MSTSRHASDWWHCAGSEAFSCETAVEPYLHSTRPSVRGLQFEVLEEEPWLEIGSCHTGRSSGRLSLRLPWGAFLSGGGQREPCISPRRRFAPSTRFASWCGHFCLRVT